MGVRTIAKEAGGIRPCDKTGHFLAILGFWKHHRPSKTIAVISSNFAAVWPVCYSRWNVSILSCDAHCCDGVGP